ncbi:MAG: response regulator [Leptolyngbyaceae cyanobacterium MO_188.B28]|nr:response regulator [Leptolyngbyaceae cyanobacterium MO_188.B28]
MPADPTRNILIVDDNPNNLGVLSDFLWDMGFEVLVARDGESALQKTQYAVPDLILLDVMMPGIDGFETCRRLKAQPATRDIPVIFMTALSESAHKVKGLSLGAVDYITKPFQQDEVLARVKLHLKLHTLNQTLAEQNLRLQREVETRKAAEAALQSLNQELESRVAARTQELSQALEDLKQAQVQMVQGEKMAALGQLVAGIAHEINNPINFIHGNVNHADTYVQDLLELLTLYQAEFPQATPTIQTKAQELDAGFLQEDLPKVLTSMKIGANRIRGIVQSLRNFSRISGPESKPVNIHEGIDSTLMILNSRLKTQPNQVAIEVIKDYGDLPLVDCYPGQLNQVFMNLLVNAIDALEDHLSQDPSPPTSPIIRISTAVMNEHQITICIANNGPSIPEPIRKQLFNPFFTTKPVGKGTGLGLSISRQIIAEIHQGSLQCHSSPAQGTEFVIQIPNSQGKQ